MGIIFSRFRRKRSTIDVLQQIEDDIAAIEEYKTGARRRQQRLSAVIVAYSVVLYLAAGLLMYYHYFPDDMTTRILCVGALLLFPAVVYLLKTLLMWYYGRKISKNELKSASLKKKKETILEEVQDKETYKVAKEILERFAPEQLRRSPLRPAGTPVPQPQQRSADALRQRQLMTSIMARTPLAATPQGRVPPVPGSGRYTGQVVQSPMPGVPGRTLQAHPGAPRAGPPLPRPVLPRERGIMDRMIDYLVGDGPANRYALICHQCQSHNGMALKEEFEYLAFRCSYCFAWNPARKQRPSAPRLPAAPTSGESMVESDTTETSGSETESERPDGADRPPLLAAGVGTAAPDAPDAAGQPGAEARRDSDAGEAAAEEGGEPGDQAERVVERPVEEAERAVKQAAEQAERVMERPVEEAERAVKQAAEQAERVMERPVEEAERAVEQVERAMERPVEDAERAMKQAERAMERPVEQAERALEQPVEQAERVLEQAPDEGAELSGVGAPPPTSGGSHDQPLSSQQADDQIQESAAAGSIAAQDRVPTVVAAEDVPFADDRAAET